ncbi:E1 ubiquitin-activating protein aos1 [Tilletia horrida]|nr:E1 ubiquitin-activating protein aos1 [Tilletia horrida]
MSTEPIQAQAAPSGSSIPAPENGSHVTEDEAALYDRQIRLWGLEAQNRMRQAHILVYNLGGVATETIKNIVLSGVGSLSILDNAEVSWSDLGAGFFFREEDVGKKRVDAALPRIQALNPLVKIHALHQTTLLDDVEQLRALKLSAIVATRGSRAELIRWNDHARALSLLFYAAGPQGFSGWIFADLGPVHSYLFGKSELVTTKDARTGESKTESIKKKVRREQEFIELGKVLDLSWKSWPPKKVSRLKLRSAGMWVAWSAWQLEETSTDPSQLYTAANITSTAAALQQTVLSLAADKGVDPTSFLNRSDAETSTYFQQYCLARSVPGEFAPTAAILGGILAQDLLNALGGREEPLCNWFQYDGSTGAGLTHRLGVEEAKTV